MGVSLDPTFGVPAGIHEDGEFRTVDQVERGLECACRCIECGDRLVAKKGNRRIHHFAHYSPGAATSHCQESTLHEFVKRLLASFSERSFPLPPIQSHRYNFSCRACGRKLPKIEFKGNLKVHILNGKTEQRVQNRRVDVLLNAQNIRSGEGPENRRTSSKIIQLIIEVNVSNKKTFDYALDISKSKIPAIEIDLSLDSLFARMSRSNQKFVPSLHAELQQVDNKRWLYSPKYGIPIQYKIAPGQCEECDNFTVGDYEVFVKDKSKLPASCTFLTGN